MTIEIIDRGRYYEFVQNGKLIFIGKLVYAFWHSKVRLVDPSGTIIGVVKKRMNLIFNSSIQIIINKSEKIVLDIPLFRLLRTGIECTFKNSIYKIRNQHKYGVKAIFQNEEQIGFFSRNPRGFNNNDAIILVANHDVELELVLCLFLAFYADFGISETDVSIDVANANYKWQPK